ncbi:hypothetical protein IAD21_02630 [Abditibacteriota bacterium]|nr:hypothetical protein IAD21_02630 [Abditibacteriota bacterium]
MGEGRKDALLMIDTLIRESPRILIINFLIRKLCTPANSRLRALRVAPSRGHGSTRKRVPGPYERTAELLIKSPFA